jgi:putative ABC transport system substrate-binding protein
MLALMALGAAGAQAPLRAQAQGQSRVAWLSSSREADGAPFLDELRRGLRELGYIEGRDLAIDAHWGDDSRAQIEKEVAEVVASKPAVVVTMGPTVLALHRATTTIPIVFGFSGDPVEAGLVDSLARPGRNLTGISFLTIELVGKRIELLKEVLPRAKGIAIVANPQHPGDKAERRASQAAAAAVGLAVEYFEVRTKTDLPGVFSAIEKSHNDAVVAFPVANIISDREVIAAWSRRTRIPVISGWAQFADGGNLMSYGPNLRESFRRLAAYVDKVLKGSRPADLPVELPTRVEFVVNLNAAKALGVTVPASTLLRADRVIE